MTTETTRASAIRPSLGRHLVSKVPEVTVFFWIIKILATTVGETAADLLGTHAGLTLTQLTAIFGSLFAVVLTAQLRASRYIPWLYWTGIVLISVVGTLITDNLITNFGIGLITTTIVFSAALAVCFGGWYASEKTLSIHSIHTIKREAWYWLTVLFTFALGTASGDLIAEQLNVGYWKSALVFAGVIGAVFASHRKLGLGAILSFWIAYIITRPLGASLGDYLSQPTDVGGLNLGTVVTSLLFLSSIASVVTYLTLTKADQEVTINSR